ncbi:MAG TPA: hypothetical protein VHS53_03445 [Mucilaginibacter sp.]|nr:hypothetical protein [Mucilaginibacter sp.]
MTKFIKVRSQPQNVKRPTNTRQAPCARPHAQTFTDQKQPFTEQIRPYI